MLSLPLSYLILSKSMWHQIILYSSIDNTLLEGWRTREYFFDSKKFWKRILQSVIFDKLSFLYRIEHTYINMEPFKTKTVRMIHFSSLDERKSKLIEANFNVFNLIINSGTVI